MPDKRFQRFSVIWAVVVALLFSWLNRAGLVITHDSLFYLDGAKHLLEGKGFYNYFWGYLVPDTHYGPVYSLSLAVSAWLFGCSPEQGALLLMALLIGLNIWLFAGLISKFELKQEVSYLLLLALPLLTPFWLIHVHVWSEALYLTFLLLAFRFSLGKTGEFRWYFVALILGLSVLVRFSGLFMLPLFGLWILFEKTAVRKKAWQFVAFSGLALLPFVLWTVRNQWQGSEMSSRVLFWQWTGFATYKDAGNTLLFWFGISMPLLLTVGLGWKKIFKSWLRVLMVVYPFIYVSLLILAKSTIDREIPMDSRLLSALLPVLWLALLSLWSHLNHRPWMRWVAILAVLITYAQFIRPAGQLYKNELGLQQSLLRDYFEQLAELKPGLSPTDTLFCRDFDFNYLKPYSKYVISYCHVVSERPFYFTRLTAPLPKELHAPTWKVDTLIADRLYYATPIDYP